MKKALKVCSIIAGSLILVGIIICAIVLVQVKFDFNKLSTYGPVEKHMETIELGTMDSITIQMLEADIKVEPSPDDKLYLTYYETKRSNVEITKEVDSLLVKEISIGTWFDLGFNFTTEETGATLLVPKQYEGDVSISTHTGRVEVKDMELSALGAKSNTGRVTIENVKADSLDVDVFTGSVLVANCMIEDTLEFEATTGNVIIEDSQIKHTMTGNVSTGKVSLTRDACEEMQISATTGAIILDQMDIKKSAVLKTSTGRISGTIADKSDAYTVRSHTSTGSNNLNNHQGAGEKILDVSTTTGSIKITFQDS